MDYPRRLMVQVLELEQVRKLLQVAVQIMVMAIHSQ